MVEPLVDQVLRKIPERQAKAIECPPPFARFYGNHPREAPSYVA